ncbi:MAG: NAD(+)/NADH kinase [Nitrososphaerales archaeon]
MNIRNVAIVAKHNSSYAEDVSRKAAKLLREKEVQVYTISPFSVEKGIMLNQLDELNDKNIDLAIAVGGDGTTLRIVRAFTNSVPIFGIKGGGTRGILATIDADELDASIKKIFQDSFHLEKRMRIYSSVNGIRSAAALNEVFVSRINVTRTPTYTIKFKEDELRQRMDGIIISTPTGSTGHSYSVGGPVLYEELDVLLLTPMNSVNRMPPLIFPDETIEIRSNFESKIVVDGQDVFEIKPDENIRIARCEHDAVFVRFKTKGLRQLAKLGF